MAQLKLLKCETAGEFKHLNTWLTRMLKIDAESVVKKYGEKGVQALSAATPRDTGKTAESWSYNYKIYTTKGGNTAGIALTWSNSNTSKNIPIVIFIECGHGTGTGGYVPPRPFVGETLMPIYEELTKELWKEVKSK